KWRCICDLCLERQFEKAEKDVKVEREKKEYKERMKNNVNKNQLEVNSNLNFQIIQLQKEVSSLENSQADKNLLNSKKAELANLKNQLNQKTQQENKTKLILGLGLGG